MHRHEYLALIHYQYFPTFNEYEASPDDDDAMKIRNPLRVAQFLF